MEVLKCNNMNEEMEENIKTIIEDSFKDEYKNKIIYAKNQLKQLYSDNKWSIFYISRDNSNSSKWISSGTIFFCKYNNFRIIIYPSKNIQEESKDDS